MPGNTLACAPPLPAVRRQSPSGAAAVSILAVLSMDISGVTCATVGMKNIWLSFQIKWLWPVFLYSSSVWHWHSQSGCSPEGGESLLAPQKPHLRGLQSSTEEPPGSMQGRQCSPGWCPGGQWQDEDTLEK